MPARRALGAAAVSFCTCPQSTGRIPDQHNAALAIVIHPKPRCRHVHYTASLQVRVLQARRSIVWHGAREGGAPCATGPQPAARGGAAGPGRARPRALAGADGGLGATGVTRGRTLAHCRAVLAFQAAGGPQRQAAQRAQGVSGPPGAAAAGRGGRGRCAGRARRPALARCHRRRARARGTPAVAGLGCERGPGIEKGGRSRGAASGAVRAGARALAAPRAGGKPGADTRHCGARRASGRPAARAPPNTGRRRRATAA